MSRVVFTREQRDLIRKARRALTDVVPIIQSAEVCGMDCDRAKAHHQFLTNFFDNLEREFLQRQPE
jgi:hypothetical protein